MVYLKTIENPAFDEGAIQFQIQGANYERENDASPKRIHNPTVGDIVLFPSSLFHRTLPFNQEMSRCVIAFDICP